MAKKIKIPPKRLLERLYQNRHLSQAKIAKRLGVSQGKISQWMIKYNIKTRHGRGKNSSQWKGGTKRTSSGRIKVYCPEHHRADGGGYVYRQILVWEKHKGDIPKDFVIHHLNGIKDDDRIENLIMMPSSSHSPYIFLHEIQKRVRELEKLLKTKGVF